jgi:trigger factor
MNVSETRVDDLNTIIKVELSPADYSEAVEKELKKISRTVAMPGFRKGKVPTGMVKKMYGKDVKSEQLNKIGVDALFGYLKENNIEYLGYPLVSETADRNLDLDNDVTYEFSYDLGLFPEFELNTPNKVFVKYTISLSEEDINEHIETLRREYGKFEKAENVEENDFVFVVLSELDEAGNIKEGGLKKSFYVKVSEIDNLELKNELIGKETGAILKTIPSKIYNDPEKVKQYITVTEEEAPLLDNECEFKIFFIQRLTLAEINQEFFDIVLGEGKVSNEEEFKALVKENLENRANSQADQRLSEDIKSELILTSKFEIPEAFLKRWLILRNENITKENVDEYFTYSQTGIRWEIILTKLSKKYEIEVSNEEIIEFAKIKELVYHYKKHGYYQDEESLKTTISQKLMDENYQTDVINNVTEDKVLTKLRAEVSTEEKAVDYKTFNSQIG